MKITCAFQYELYVDETRRAALSRNAGCRRFVFNKALEIQNERKSKGEKLLTYKPKNKGNLTRSVKQSSKC